MKEEIIATVDNLIASFLWYDRKEDEDLPNGAIEKAIDDGVITVEEIVERFREQLIENI